METISQQPPNVNSKKCVVCGYDEATVDGETFCLDCGCYMCDECLISGEALDHVCKEESMKEEEEIDHRYTKEAVCPYCGHQFNDSWEFGEEDQDVECPACGKKFHLRVERETTYCTDADCKMNNEEHDWIDGAHQLPSTFIQRCSKCDNINFLPKPGEELELKLDNGSVIKVCGCDKTDEADRLRSLPSPGFPHF